jgi:hypothetical protein
MENLYLKLLILTYLPGAILIRYVVVSTYLSTVFVALAHACAVRSNLPHRMHVSKCQNRHFADMCIPVMPLTDAVNLTMIKFFKAPAMKNMLSFTHFRQELSLPLRRSRFELNY